MVRKHLGILVLILCFGLILIGCPKKTAVNEQASVKNEGAVSKREAESTRETKAKEQFEKSLVAKQEPGIKGEVFESELLKDIHFDFDKYNIRPGDGEILNQTVALLKKYPKIKIQVEGHCDERGTVEYNLALGQRRANSTKTYLVSHSISSNRISTISYGKEKPLDSGHNEEAWAKNRRGHTIVTSK
jgi:peptidoglycan-associated lipoprotein